jgi:hypothetical protein
VFAFFCVEAPQRVAEARLAEAEGKKKTKAKAAGGARGKVKKGSKEAAAYRGGLTTEALEKKKRRGDGGGARPKKRSRLIDTFFTQSPLHSRGDSEEEVESSEDNGTAEKTLAASIFVVPVRAKPAFSLQWSDPELESDDEVLARPHAMAALVVAVEKSPERAATSSSEKEEEVNVEELGESGHTPPLASAAAKGEQVGGEAGSGGSSSSESSGYLLSTSNPTEVVEALGMTNARLVGGQVVRKHRFESGQRERDFLSEAGDSYFPLMERRLMMTGPRHALRCAEDHALKSYVAAWCASQQLNAECDQPLRIASLEQKFTGLE